MQNNTVLVIIVTYNGMKWLEKCLNSIVNSSIPLDVYIVDNGSADGSQQFITTNYPQFTFYQSPTNSGFGAANNIVLKYAIEHNYDYVYLLNQDAWVLLDTITTLIKVNKSNPEYGILSPLQTNAKKTKLDENFKQYSVKTNQEIAADHLIGNIKNVYSVDFVMAAHWLVSKECFLKVGLFSPVFYHYGEDNNYVHRCKYFNLKIGIVPSVIGVHDREYREETKKQAIYKLKPLFLILASDINKSTFMAILNAIKKLFRSTISKSIQYKDVSIFFSAVPIILSIRWILRDRKKNKTTANV